MEARKKLECVFMKMLLRYFRLALLLSVIGISSTSAIAGDLTHRNHLSILTGGTHIPDVDATAWTLGLDYEYRVNHPLGLGMVVEHAFGELNATTLLAVADIHLHRGLVLQVGPGVEFIDGHSALVGRVGALYEFEFPNHFTISPQLHYDVSRENSIVFGLAAGMSF